MGEFVKNQTLTARKPHRCGLCFGKIEVGERYARYTGLLEDRGFLTEARHLDCTPEALRDRGRGHAKGEEG
jgi:hypothetical protein